MGKLKQMSIGEVKQILIQFWKNTDEWKRYHEIRNYLRTFPKLKDVNERTIMRYLAELEKTGFLEKRVEKTHQTYYKIKEPLSSLIKKSSQIIPENAPIFALVKAPDVYLHLINWWVTSQPLLVAALLKEMQKFDHINVEEVFQTFLDYEVLPNLRKLFMKLLEQDHEILFDSFSYFFNIYLNTILPYLLQNAKGDVKVILTNIASDYDKIMMEKLQELMKEFKT